MRTRRTRSCLSSPIPGACPSLHRDDYGLSQSGMRCVCHYHACSCQIKNMSLRASCSENGGLALTHAAKQLHLMLAHP